MDDIRNFLEVLDFATVLDHDLEKFRTDHVSCQKIQQKSCNLAACILMACLPYFVRYDHCYNQSLETGVFPEAFKYALVALLDPFQKLWAGFCQTS